MSTAASLSLLKGGQKASAEQEPENEEVAAQADAEAGEEEVVVDVDKMTAKQLDALVKEHEIEVPDTWAKMTVPKKKEWLKEQFEEAPEGEAEPEAEQPAEPEAPAAEEAAPEPAAEPAPAKAKKAAGKGKAATASSGGDDLINDLVHEIENMSEKNARSAVKDLTNESEMTLFKLGGVLSVIQAHNWFDPFASFREYVEKELGMHYRKATYWVAIYNSLSESKVPWDKVKHIGWTKLKEIAEVLTVENVDDWVKLAEGQTTLQLIETVKAHKAKDAPKPSGEEAQAKTVTTKTFKVHEDQKATIEAAIAKAKESTGTDTDTVALEFICIDYIGGQTMAQKLKAMGLEAALEAIDKAYPDVTLNVEMPE